MRKFLYITFVIFTFSVFAQSPVAHYTFSGDALDQSGNGNDVTVDGATLTTDRFGNTNSAYSFDGVDDFIYTNTALSQTPANITFTAWFNFPASASSGTYQIAEINGSSAIALLDGSFQTVLNLNSNFEAPATPTTSDEWHFGAFTYDGTTYRSYLDGVLFSEQTNAGPIGYIGTSSLNIGSTSTDNFFLGSLDELKIYAQALDAEEISSLYQSQSEGLLAQYDFDGDATDASGNGNGGTVIGATLSTDRLGNANSSFSFDGIDDYIITSNANAFNNYQQGSISLWFKSSSSSTSQTILTYAPDGASAPLSITFNGSVIRYGYKVVGSSSAAVFDGTTTVELDSWNHLLISNDGVNPSEIYLNGNLETTSFTNNGNGADGSEWFADLREIGNLDHFLGIGAHAHGTVESYFEGEIDEVRIYSKPLTSNEISEIYQQGAFITTWQTTVDNEQVTIPINELYTYNYTVDWGDGDVISGYTGSASHTYATAGTYSVSIIGDFPAINFSSSAANASQNQIQSVEQWGDINWVDFTDAFNGCSNLSINATDAPDLTSVTTLFAMFSNTSFSADLNVWDLSTITDTRELFSNSSFNGDISLWNVFNVTQMNSMFSASTFNGDISGWEVDNVTSMTSMFSNSSFNGDISSWDVSKVEDMESMFNGANSFNQPLSNWATSSLTNMPYMFFNAGDFNQDISSWDVDQVGNMEGLFQGAISFNQGLGSWDISSVSIMTSMFNNAGMSVSNYGNTLAGWAELSSGETQIPTSITLGASGLEYCEGESARDILVNTYSWTIDGDTKNCFIASYSLDGDANDASGYGRDGTVNGAELTTDRFGNANSAYIFDGIDDYIALPIQTNELDSSFTITAWASLEKVNQGTGSQGIISSAVDNTDGGVFLGIQSITAGDRSVGILNNDADEAIFARNQESFTPRTDWIFYALSYDGTELSIYEDGVLVTSTSTSGNADGAGDFRIGSNLYVDGTLGYFGGSIDDVALYTTSMSASEVSALYSSESSIIASYSFSGNANNEAVTGNNGTVNGATLTTDRFGNDNSAYSFDGASQIVLESSLISNEAQASISWWVNLDDVETRQVIADFGNITLTTTQGFMYFGINEDGIGTTEEAIAVTAGSWIHFVGTFDGSNIRMYRDGELISTTSFTGSIGTRDIVSTIGSNTVDNEYVTGNLDDFQIFNYALSEGEIQEIYSENQWPIETIQIVGSALTGESNSDQKEMALINQAYYASVYLYDGTINFQANGTSEISWGDTEEDGLADVDGTEFSFTEGLYAIRFSPFNDTYSITEITTVGFLGSARTGDDDGWLALDTDMFHEGNGIYSLRIELNELDAGGSSAWKLRANDDWLINWGGANGTLVYFGENIPLDNSGVYNITADLNNLTYEISLNQPVITAFSLVGESSQGVIDEVEESINMDLGQGFDITNMVAEFTLASGASAAVNGVSQVSGVTVNDYTNPVVYVITSDDGSVSNWVVTVDQFGADGLIAYYPFTGNAEEQISGYNGTISGDVVLAPDRFGNTDQAYSFDGGNDFIQTDFTPTNQQPFALSLWVYWDSADDIYKEFVSFTSDDETIRTYFGVTGTNTIRANNESLVALSTSAWNHLIFNYDGTDIDIIVNGESKEVLSNVGFDFSTMTIGAYNRSGGESWNGDIDDIRFYNRVVTAEEINELYREDGWIPEQGALVAQYSFTGDANDISGLGRDGTLGNGSNDENTPTLDEDRFGTADNAYYYDGDDIITYNATDNLAFGNEVTVAAWIVSNAYSSSEPEILSNAADGNGFDFKLSGSGDTRGLKAEVFGSNNTFLIEGDLSTSEWYNVAFTYARNGSLILYVDGVEIGSTAASDNAILTSTRNLVSGTGMDGSIDELIIYDEALSAESIYSLYYNSAPLSSDKELFSFNLAGVEGELNVVNNTVNVVTPFGTDLTTLAADFNVSTKATVLSNNTTQESGVTTNDFTNPVIYTVKAEDMTTETWVVTATKNLVEGDSLALLALYDSTDGDNWTPTKWDLTQPVSTWGGLTFNGDGRVTSIILDENNLTGSIPIEIGDLGELLLIQMTGNNLTNEIPASVGNLSNLQSIYLNRNQLTGAIPTELGNLSDEVFFDMDLSDNSLNGEIPPSLGNLNGLRTLDLSRNDLSGSIPSELSNITELNYLYLSSNDLTGNIPSGLGDLSSLFELFLNGNALEGEIPQGFGNLDNLDYLNLGSNNLSGEIPIELGGMNKLRILYLYDNNLSGGIPTELGDLALLQDLWLNGNNLTGSIPTSLGNLTVLDRLFLNENELSGTVPSELGGLADLTYLYLQSNDLSGELPAEIADLSSLRSLSIINNQIEGIPVLTGLPLDDQGVRIQDNKIGFSDIIDNLQLATDGKTFEFDPQVVEDTVRALLPSEGLTISTTETTSNTSYQWTKDDSNIADANSETYLATELGTYTVVMTNAGVDNLTITRAPYILTGQDATDFISFSFDGIDASGVIDLDNHTIAIVVPFASPNLDNTVPVFEISPGASADIGGDAQTSGVSFVNFTNPITYTITAQDGITTQDWLATATVGPNGANDIESFTIDGQVSSSVDASNHTVDVIMPFGVARNDLQPNVAISVNAIISPETTVAQNFDDPFTYTITSESGEAQEWVVTVTNALNSETDILNFDIQFQIGEEVIDTDNHTVAIRMENGTDASFLTPFITVSDGGSVSPNSAVTQDFSAGAVNYTVTAQDGVISQVWSATVTVEAATNNEITALTINSNEIAENESAGSLVGAFITGDPDEDDVHLYSLVTGTGETDNGSFFISGNSLLTNEVFDFESKNSYLIRVQADDQRGSTFPVEFTINITNVNETPFVDDETFTIDENSSNESIIGTINAGDPDNDNLTFSISGGNDLGAFVMNSASGEITVADETQLDFETTSTFSLAVVASDGDLSGFATITIDVNNINEVTTFTFSGNPTSSEKVDFDVTATVTDEDAITSVKLYTKKVAGSSFTAGNSISVGSSNDYTQTINGASAMDNIGVEYYFELEDEFGTQRSDTMIVSTVVGSDDVDISNQVTPGVSVSNYTILAFPFEGVNIPTVFGGLGENQTDWRLLRYAAGENIDNNSGPLTPGVGYWFITKTASPVINTGGKSVATDNGVFRIDLDPSGGVDGGDGYTLIGNPFQASLNWTDVIQHNIDQGIITSGEVQTSLIGYSSQFTSQSSLSAFEGAFIQSSRSVNNFEIPVLATSNGGRIAANKNLPQDIIIDNSEWELDLFFETNSYQYSIGGVGISREAKDERDGLDFSVLPRLELYLDLLFEDGSTRSIKQSADFKSWSFNVRNNLPEEKISMSWDIPVSSSKTIILVDGASKQIFDLGKTKSIELKNDPNARHQLYYGNKETIFENLNLDFDAYYGAYPNPVENVLTIEMIGSSQKDVPLTLLGLDGKSFPVGSMKLLEGLNKEKINLEEYSIPAGVYFLKVENKVVTKILKR